ncbi:MAG: hypothetical protein ACR2GH_04825 [Pseudonocardia sp.]
MRTGRIGVRLRAVTGLLAGGLVALVVVLGAAWFIASRTGTTAPGPGPGPGTLAWHGVAAAAAVLAQRHADRHSGTGGTVAALAVIGVSAAVLAAQWLA